MTRTTRMTIAAAFALLLLGSAAAAQESLPAQSTAKGFSVGAHGAMTASVDDGSPSDNGMALMVGYGINERLSFHSGTAGERIKATGTRDSFFQSFIDIESRLTFGGVETRWRPHLALGVSGRTEHDEQPDAPGDDPKVRTTIGTTTGGGLSYYVSRGVSLDGAVRYTFGDANRTRVLLGVTWFPRAR